MADFVEVIPVTPSRRIAKQFDEIEKNGTIDFRAFQVVFVTRILHRSDPMHLLLGFVVIPQGFAKFRDLPEQLPAQSALFSTLPVLQKVQPLYFSSSRWFYLGPLLACRRVWNGE
jgi:hypothetical protein